MCSSDLKARAEIGDPVVVFGTPLGLSDTVTTGVVSAYRTEEGTDFVQFSAPVSPGSSGGPVVDHDSAVLGVTTSKITEQNSEGLSFAVTSDEICRAFELDC